MMKGYKSALVLFVAMLLMFSMAPFQAFAEKGDTATLIIDTQDEQGEQDDNIADTETSLLDDDGNPIVQDPEKNNTSDTDDDNAIDGVENDENAENNQGDDYLDQTKPDESNSNEEDSGVDILDGDDVNSDLNSEGEKSSTDIMLSQFRSGESQIIPLVFLDKHTDANTVTLSREINITDYLNEYINSDSHISDKIELHKFFESFKVKLIGELPLVFGKVMRNGGAISEPSENNINEWIQSLNENTNDLTTYRGKFKTKEELSSLIKQSPKYSFSDNTGIKEYPLYVSLDNNWNINILYDKDDSEQLSNVISLTSENKRVLNSGLNPRLKIELDLTMPEGADPDAQLEELYFYNDHLKGTEKHFTPFRIDAAYKRYELQQKRFYSVNNETEEFKYQKFDQQETEKFADDIKFEDYFNIYEPEQTYYDVEYALLRIDADEFVSNNTTVVEDVTQSKEYNNFLVARMPVDFKSDHRDKAYEWKLITDYMNKRGVFVGDKISGIIPIGKISNETKDSLKYKNKEKPLTDNFVQTMINEVDSGFVDYNNLAKNPTPIFKSLILKFEGEPNQTIKITLSFAGATMPFPTDTNPNGTAKDKAILILKTKDLPYTIDEIYTPVKEGYKFESWSSVIKTEKNYVVDVMIDQDLEAKFTEVLGPKLDISLQFKVPTDKNVSFAKGVNDESPEDGSLKIEGSNLIYTYMISQKTQDEISTVDWKLPRVTSIPGQRLKLWKLEDNTKQFLQGNDKEFSDWLKKQATENRNLTFIAEFEQEKNHLPQFDVSFNAKPFKITKTIKGDNLDTPSETDKQKINAVTRETEIKELPTLDTSKVPTQAFQCWKLENDPTDSEITTVVELRNIIDSYPGRAEYKFTAHTLKRQVIALTVEVPTAYSSEVIGIYHKGEKSKETLEGKVSANVLGPAPVNTWKIMLGEITLQHEGKDKSKNMLLGFDPNFDQYKSGNKSEQTAEDKTFVAIFVPKEAKYDGTYKDNLLRVIHAAEDYKKSDEYKKKTELEKIEFDEAVVEMGKVFNSNTSITESQFNEAVKNVEEIIAKNPNKNTNMRDIFNILTGQNKLVDPATGVSIEWVELQPNDKLVVKPISTDVLNNTGKVQAAVLYDIYIERNNKKLILDKLTRQIKVGIPVPESCREITMGFPKFKDNYTVYYVEVNAENKPTQLRAVSPVQIEADNKAYFLTNHLSYWAIAKPIATGAEGTEGKVDTATAPNQTTKIPATGEAGTPLFIAVAVLSLGIVLMLLRKRMK